ncbi:MAG: FIST N-terminal domain-containing protein [Myxococcota bacterium]
MQVELRHWKGSWSQPLPDGAASVVLVFGDPALADDPAPLHELREAYPDAVHAGCSSSGEILGTEIHEGTLVAAIVTFAHVEARAVTREIADPAQSREIGAALAADLSATPGLRHVFLLSDGLGVNGSALAAGVQHALPEGVVVTGGLAGDGARFQRTWVFDGEAARSGVVRAIGLYGSALRVGHGSEGGWIPFGVGRVVTRSVGNVLYELDGKPALALYKEYLGERASGLPATGLLFPLSLRDGTRHDIVRTILAVDERDQSLTFAGDIPQGSRVQLMRADSEALVEAAGSAASAASDDAGPVLGLAVSCVGRRLVLGERTEEEVEETLDQLPPGSWLTGFYSYGELSPGKEGGCDLHNQTMTLTTWREVGA